MAFSEYQKCQRFESLKKTELTEVRFLLCQEYNSLSFDMMTENSRSISPIASEGHHMVERLSYRLRMANDDSNCLMSYFQDKGSLYLLILLVLCSLMHLVYQQL